MALSPEQLQMIAQRASQYASAAPQFVLGGWQYLNAIKQARQNVRPNYQIDPSYQNNIDWLTNTMGLPQSALDLYYNRIGQNTNQGINAINGLGGNANQIANLVGNQNASFENIALQDSLQKKQDIGGVIAARMALAEQKDKAWQINKFAPYADKVQAIASEKAAGLTNLQGSLNSIMGANANIATSQLADSMNSNGGLNLPTSQPTTPNSGVNVNAIIASLNQPKYMPSQPPNAQYNYLPQAPPNNNLDYQSWFNSIMRRQMATANPSEYQYNQYTGY